MTDLEKELLEVLELCLPLVEQFDGTSVENEKILDTARAALAKARGES